jgi:hypothetical protein
MKAVIAAGLTLSAEGKRLAQARASDEETQKALTPEMRKKLHLWTHSNTAAQGKDYDYSEE